MKIFWSWQSDTPGDTGRFFVRDALQDTIQALKEAPDIEEPVERAAREALHLDQDRLGVPGSPDLAKLILEKIDKSTVFVADVTPVGETRNPKKKDRKKLINPNVAIELGYALRAMTDRALLMVMNEHYGSLEDLPFDLRHKAGPVRFRLAPDATKEIIKAERQRFAGELKKALREFLRAQTPPTIAPSVPEMQAKSNPAAYFDIAEHLASIGDPEEDQTHYSYASTNGLYLRVIPTQPLVEPLPLSDIKTLIHRAHYLQPLHERFTQSFRQLNRYGGIVVEPDRGQQLRASTQVFENGEIWGFNAHLLSRRRNSGEIVIPVLDLEQTFASTLTDYLQFASKEMGHQQPLTVIAGMTGIEGAYLGLQDQRRWGPIRKSEVSHRAVLNEPDSELARGQFLLIFFEKLFDAAGYKRPKGLHGFPPAPGR